MTEFHSVAIPPTFRFATISRRRSLLYTYFHFPSQSTFNNPYKSC